MGFVSWMEEGCCGIGGMILFLLFLFLYVVKVVVIVVISVVCSNVFMVNFLFF